MTSALQFTLPEILSLLGVVQSVYVLVYMLFRSGSFSNAIIPSLYFIFMAAAFLSDAAAAKIAPGIEHYELWRWLFWFSGVPLGTMLIFQVATVGAKLEGRYFVLLVLIPIALLPAYAVDDPSFMYVSGLVIGTLSVLAIWLRRDVLDGLHGSSKFGEERFWLIISLVLLNVAFLGSTLAYVSEVLTSSEWILVRTILGIAFVYIAATSLFRIYPQAVRLDRTPPGGQGAINSEDKLILDTLNSLFEHDKIYQDSSYGRAELARELKISEANLSRLVNIHYQKTIPQMLNELRVKDAQRLLKETDASIQNIFEESGFSSITTFNRVFKELTGDTPKEYRGRFRT